MAFEVLTHHCDSDIANLFLWMSDEESFRATTLLTYGIPDYADESFNPKEFAKRYEEQLKNHAPALVLNFLPPQIKILNKDYFRQTELCAKLCARYNIPFIQFSSWQAGNKECKTDEAKWLRKIEALIAAKGKARQLILRTDWLLDASSESLFAEFLPLLVGGSGSEVVSFSSKIQGAPVSSRYVVESLIAVVYQVLCGAENWKLYHISGSDYCSEAEVADNLTRVVADLLEENAVKIEASETAESLMGCSSTSPVDRELVNDFGIQKVTWRRGLKRAVAKRLSINS